MKIGFVQMDVRFGQVEHNLAKADMLMAPVTADLLVLPELFSSGYLFADCGELKSLAEMIPGGPTTQFLIKTAREKNCYLVAGMAEKAGDRFYNSAVLVGPAGYLAVYRKVHLYDQEKRWFDPGDQPFFVVDIGSAKLGMMICFDWFFPESARSLALLGADIICHPANLVMPFCQKAMVTRCLENHLFAVTANRIGKDARPNGELSFTGCSQITAPDGGVLKTAGADEETVCLAEIDVEQAREKKINAMNDLLNDRRPECYCL
jgi:predicted amidohydrolase